MKKYNYRKKISIVIWTQIQHWKNNEINTEHIIFLFVHERVLILSLQKVQ